MLIVRKRKLNTGEIVRTIEIRLDEFNRAAKMSLVYKQRRMAKETDILL